MKFKSFEKSAKLLGVTNNCGNNLQSFLQPVASYSLTEESATQVKSTSSRVKPK